jgi:hypothetical protein
MIKEHSDAMLLVRIGMQILAEIRLKHIIEPHGTHVVKLFGSLEGSEGLG